MCYICWCWVGKGCDVSTIHIPGDTLSGCVIRTAPWGLVLSTPLTVFAWVLRILLSAWFAWYLVFVSGGWYVLILLVLGWGGVVHKHN